MKSKVEDADYLLNTTDRCDACNSQAYIYVKLESGDLLFCLHHWKDNREILSGSAQEVVDESERLLVR